jgi:hypothetical protein
LLLCAQYDRAFARSDEAAFLIPICPELPDRLLTALPPRRRSDASCRAMTVLDLMRTTNQIIARLDRAIQ